MFSKNIDDPSVSEDYDCDGKTDMAVYRPGATVGAQSFWYYKTSPTSGTFFVPWGINNGADSQGFSKGDFPAPGDYDGDGKADFVVQRNDTTSVAPNTSSQANYWRRLTGSGGSVDSVRFGFPSDNIVTGDYDGDGKTDIAVFRIDATTKQWDWYYKPSSAPAEAFRYLGRWGSDTTLDYPAQGDYDGDGKTDIAVWRPNSDS